MTDQEQLTGADALVRTLANCGVTACFANPGTSEMNLVTALDREPRIRSVLCLFEGVATGAADGFARISGTPAMTLLHLGPGYMNSGANIHNARRGHVPMINVIGDHATYHQRYDAPLASNIIGLAGPNSVWIKSANSPSSTSSLAREAFTASFGPKAGPVSLVLPADSAWLPGGEVLDGIPAPALCQTAAAEVTAAAEAIKSAKKPVIIMNGTALLEDGLIEAARLSNAGIRVLTDTFVTRQRRGAGVFAPDRMQYFAEGAMADLEGVDLMVLAGTSAPVAFFAYPEKPSLLVPEGCNIVDLGGADTDSGGTLKALADAIGANTPAPAQERVVKDKPTGPLTPAAVGASVNRHMPADTVISDDGVTASMPIFLSTINGNPHDLCMLTGGAIGQGLPLAVGTAIARPEAPTLCLSGDGAGMYTNQALWTMAREKLDVVTIVFVNHSYRILNIELARTGAGNPGPAAQNMLNLGGPEIDWVKLAEAQGVTAFEASTAEEFDDQLKAAFDRKGPTLLAALVS